MEAIEEAQRLGGKVECVRGWPKAQPVIEHTEDLDLYGLRRYPTVEQHARRQLCISSLFVDAFERWHVIPSVSASCSIAWAFWSHRSSRPGVALWPCDPWRSLRSRITLGTSWPH